MPFTLAHPAAALPLRKLNLIWSAFVVGSMAPDFPYISGSAAFRPLGHRWPGLLEFTLPASLVALWLFHNVLKGPVIGLLPIAIQARLQGVLRPFRFGGPERFFAIVLSIVLGIATHLVWDSFTHAYTWPWYHLHWLEGWWRLPVFGWTARYFVLQYASSILGMLVLALWGWHWYRTTPPHELKKSRQPLISRFPLAVAMFTLAGAIGLLRAKALIGIPIPAGKVDAFVLLWGVTSLALAFWQLLLYCVLVSSHQVWTLT